VPPLPAPYGDTGADFFAFAARAVPATEHRPVVTATGAAGEVSRWHPLLVHAAQPHRGRNPRSMAQPPLIPVGRLDIRHPKAPVERVVYDCLP
jgi:hypothetical protein